MTTPPASEGRDPAEFDSLLADAHGRFERSSDGTLGIEEEYAICHPDSLDLVPLYDEVREAAIARGLDDAVAGELLASEIEFRTGRCETWSDAVAELTALRAEVARSASDAGVVLGTSSTHPWADYREQDKIDTPYYRSIVERLQYVAHRNNTFGLHVHVGVQGADRAIAVHDAMRTIQPLLLALSTSSPFLDGRDTGLSSARAMTFSRSFPRGNVAPAFGTFQGYIDHMTWLRDAGSIQTAGQVWWGTRPHLVHGTVELRMFDGQPDVRDTLGLAALASGVIAHLCALHDAGELPPPLPEHLIDENSWRATRYGTDAEFIQLPGSSTLPAHEALLALAGDAREAGRARGLGIDEGIDRVEEMVAAGSSATWQRSVFEATGDLEGTYRQVVEVTMASAAAALEQ